MTHPAVSVVIPAWRDAGRAIEAARSVLAQDYPRPDVIVVDDGSGDGSAERLEDALPGQARVLGLTQNLGRAAARNAGAAIAGGELLMFLDCDCRPLGNGFLTRHAATLAQGAVASCGPVEGIGTGFWHEYQRAASARRARHAAGGRAFAGSTQNLMVRRDAFLAAGGFDPALRAYGFEDRDLLLRLAAHGAVAWTPDAAVRHLDALSLPSVCAKMREAGAGNASMFARRHPAAYRDLGYAALDVRLRPGLRWPIALLSPLLPRLARGLDHALDWHLPFRWRAAAVRLLSGASYAAGTYDAMVRRAR